MLSKLWKDEAGFVVSAELIFVATILVIGLVTGWVAIRNAALSELTEVANALATVDQSYSYNGRSNCASSTAGSGAVDTVTSMGAGSTSGNPQNIYIGICP